MPALPLERHPVHLGLGAVAEAEQAFTGDMAWYEAYAARHAADGAEGRLVSMHRLTESWTSWEMHPSGAEVVVCLSGEIVLHQEAADGNASATTLRAGEYAINPPSVWHTADVTHPATVLFVTAGLGTRHRPR
jgi:quercetin dioxygenase-like cupin family protein